MNYLEEAKECTKSFQTLGERALLTFSEYVFLNALIAIAEELKQANELHTYFEEAMKEEQNE